MRRLRTCRRRADGPALAATLRQGWSAACTIVRAPGRHPATLWLLVAPLVLVACPAPKLLADGTGCHANAECTSQFCSGSTVWHQALLCAEPKLDRDGDGLPEITERLLGTDPSRADSDGDGLADGIEVGADPTHPTDSDGDGRIDALEDGRADSDRDCIADPYDADDKVPATSSALAAWGCTAGVCALATGATCEPDSRKITCEVGADLAYEPGGEASCDGIDNDCDGLTDEQLDGKAGAACAAVGVCTGAKASTCTAAKWLCNFADVPDYEAVETRCDGLDNDCDGHTDDAGICIDAVACTLDSCDPAHGCVHAVDDKLCNDGKPCTIDACDAVTGCRSVARIGPCDDGQICTQGEHCQSGECGGGTAVPCDDGLQCTLDHCDPVKGCVAANLPGGSACMPGLTCIQAGECDKGACVATTTVQCDDANACTQDACDPATGQCTHAATGAVCNDGNPCTANDHCTGKVCGGTPLDTCCKSDADCADSSDCTVDTCANGSCINDIVAGTGKPCDDGNACTKGENCVLGVCAAALFDKCSDGNACTLDVCNPTFGCQHTVLADGAGCDDGDVCNGVDACLAGQCQIGAKLTCADTNPCTIDACDKQKGCQFTATTGACDDGNACTTKDTCGSGSCLGAPLLCNDNNPCTVDSCDTIKGCFYTPVTGPCNDGNGCTASDTCQAGACIGMALDCDDDNACTVDACDAKKGCGHDAGQAESTACNDGSACTVGDTCKSGACTPGTFITCDDKNPCTDDKCDAVSGFCKHAFNAAPCNDGTGCTSDGGCKSGVCKGTDLPNCCKLNGDCEDGNPCTIDACTKSTGTCFHTLVDGFPCDDGSKCTVGDGCQKGACIGGANQGCDDGKPCTADFCLPSSGCQHLLLVSGPCSDGNPCNGPETCTPAGCVAGKPPVCDDGNPCTLDDCDKTGCTHAWLQPGKPCSDGSACTTADACDGKGTCKGTPTTGPGCCKVAADCDDGYACSTDTCNTALATCTHTGLQCTSADLCAVAYCQDGACTNASSCAAPQVYVQGFESTASGWSLTGADAPAGLAWAVTSDAAAVDGVQSLHVGYGTGSFKAALPDLALAPGKYVLTLYARLDVDSNDCTLGSLQLSLGGQPLGVALCASGPAQLLIQRPFTVATGSKSGKMVIEFQGVAQPANSKRGAWVDAVQVNAVPDGACSCP